MGEIAEMGEIGRGEIAEDGRRRMGEIAEDWEIAEDGGDREER